MTRGKKISLGIIALFTVSVIIFLVWLTGDIDPVDDSAYLPDEYVKVPGIENSFKELEVLRREFLASQSKEGNLLDDLMESFEESTDEILASDFSKNLEENLKLALQKKYFEEKELKSFDYTLEHVGFYRSITKILTRQALRNWDKGERVEALETLKLLDEFTAKFGSNTQAVIGVLVAMSMHGIVDDYLLKILDTGNCTAEELTTLQQFHERRYLQRQMRTAIKWDYKLCFVEFSKQIVGVKSILYLENETKAFYINYIDPVFKALEKEKLFADPGLNDQADAKLEDYSEKGFRYRNVIGKTYLSIMLPSFGNTVKKIKQVYIKKELLELRIALELYRKKHESYPEELESLTPEFISELPKDPWSKYKNNYIYDLEAGKLYSIGENYSDDGGHFKENLAYRSKDYGVIFK